MKNAYGTKPSDGLGSSIQRFVRKVSSARILFVTHKHLQVGVPCGSFGQSESARGPRAWEATDVGVARRDEKKKMRMMSDGATPHATEGGRKPPRMNGLREDMPSASVGRPLRRAVHLAHRRSCSSSAVGLFTAFSPRHPRRIADSALRKVLRGRSGQISTLPHPSARNTRRRGGIRRHPLGTRPSAPPAHRGPSATAAAHRVGLPQSPSRRDDEGPPHRRQYAPLRPHSPDRSITHSAPLCVDFPRTADGRVYHLGVRAGEVANRIVRSIPTLPAAQGRLVNCVDHGRLAQPRGGHRSAF